MNENNEVKKELDPEEMSADILFEDEVASNDGVSEAKEVITESVAENIDENKADEALEIPLEEYRIILEEHFQNLKNLIKYTKTKDETIYKLSNELQKYREDYCAKTFKSIATLIISFREDCRKSLSDLNSFDLTFEKAKKFLSFLGDDFEELLSNAGCEEGDDTWCFNGKPLSIDTPATIKFPQLFVVDETNENNNAVIDGNNVKEYLADAEAKIKLILADNEKLDKCLKDYCSLASAIENDIVILCIYPSVRKLISLYNKTKQKIDVYLSELSEDNMVDSYSEILTFLISQLEDVLLSGGVKIDTTTDDLFDTRKNRLVRAVTTDDSALDRKIAKQHTECYTMNDVVLYPAKVDVYKYQP